MSTYGQDTPVCANENVFFVNHQLNASLTNIHYYDASAGAWSGNLLGSALPYAFLPPFPLQVNDLVVFGTDSTRLVGKPFTNLVFDIVAGLVNPLTFVWRYSQGGANPTAWPALTVQDNTFEDGVMVGNGTFDTAGVKSVAWVLPNNWAVYNPTIAAAAIGVTGYWVCAHITAIVGATNPVQQQNNDIYTVHWPYIEVSSDDIGGDVSALSQIYLKNQSDQRAISTFHPYLPSDRVIVGLRSLDRGDMFKAFINLTNDGDPEIQVIQESGTLSYVSSSSVPAAKYTQDTNPAAAWTRSIAVLFSDAISSSYFGTFRAFLRGYQTNGAAGDIRMKLTVGLRDGLLIDKNNIVSYQTLDFYEVLDMGSISIPPVSHITREELQDLEIVIWIYGNGVTDHRLFDLVLIPVDEWSLDTKLNTPDYAYQSLLGARGLPYDNRKLNIDSVTFPKSRISSNIESYNTKRSPWQTISNGSAILQSNSNQRLWFMQIMETSSTSESFPEILTTAQVYAIQRYFSLRGDN